uniref:Endomucin n=1 Tax=Prolemur simus TaxID=1328070 RepID=A0A8C9A2L1_PROSS
MELLRVTILLLLSSLCNSEKDTDVISATPKLPSANSTTITSTPTPSIVPLPNTVITSTSPKGANSSEILNASLVTTVSSFITVKSEELGTTANGASKNESTTTNATVTNPPLPNAVSTSQSFQHKTENQSTIKTTKITGTPENGNDQPQSDKESVKLLTVKTISHESGEHSAHAKTKN